MSRGFVKEDDQEEPPFIPPRAPLPDGVLNYVTPRGMRMLEEERNELEKERRNILDKAEEELIGDDERRRDLLVINGKLDLLAERIATAQVIVPDGTPEEVRFGTTVTFRHRTGPLAGRTLEIKIVGADEADVKEHRIAFTAPIARALIGKRVGEVAGLQLGPQSQQLEILKII
jgi:transcription elongation factor GreB